MPKEMNAVGRPWTVDEIVATTGLPDYTIRKFVRAEELVTAAKRMVRTSKQVPYYYRSAARLLYAIALEAGLKALWEIDNGREVRHTHDMSEIFEGLHPERCEKHQRWYDLIANQAGASVNLSEALQANARMVKDFKYGDYEGNSPSAVGGEIVDDVVLGGEGALISYGQFVVDDLENILYDIARPLGSGPPS